MQALHATLLIVRRLRNRVDFSQAYRRLCIDFIKIIVMTGMRTAAVPVGGMVAIALRYEVIWVGQPLVGSEGQVSHFPKTICQALACMNSVQAHEPSHSIHNSHNSHNSHNFSLASDK